MMKDLRFIFLGTNIKNRTPSPSKIRVSLINFEKKSVFLLIVVCIVKRVKT
jgi:hypothetical protein